MKCEARPFFFGSCLEEATRKILGGCRHEHVKVRDLCVAHAADILRPDSVGVCMECYDAGHDCSVSAKVFEEHL